MNIKNNKNCKITINDEVISVSEKGKTADEKWITIKHNKNYEVSNEGNVRNKNTKRVLKPAISNKGYYLVALSDKGKSHTYTIHKLVMEHFNRCAFDREVINHIDCNKLNNNINNLEYVTQKENCIKAWENKLCEGIRKKATKRIHSKEIKTSKAVIQYDLNGSKIKEFVSIRDAERQTGIDNSNITACCKLRKRIAGGYIWRYKQAINKKCKELRLDMIETETGKVLNKLAREQFKSKLLAEILIDLQVCKLENLNPKEYIEELKQEIDNIYERFNNENE